MMNRDCELCAERPSVTTLGGRRLCSICAQKRTMASALPFVGAAVAAAGLIAGSALLAEKLQGTRAPTRRSRRSANALARRDADAGGVLARPHASSRARASSIRSSGATTRSNASFRSSRVAARTIRVSSASPASARRRSSKVSRSASRGKRSRSRCATNACSRSRSGRWSPARSIAASSKAASNAFSTRSSAARATSSSSSTSCTRSSAPGAAEGALARSELDDQARTRARRTAVHRRDDVRRVPQVRRVGRRARTPLPTGDGRGAEHRADDRDSSRIARTIRNAPSRHDPRRRRSKPRRSLRRATSPTGSCPTKRSISWTRPPRRSLFRTKAPSSSPGRDARRRRSRGHALDRHSAELAHRIAEPTGCSSSKQSRSQARRRASSARSLRSPRRFAARAPGCTIRANRSAPFSSAVRAASARPSLRKRSRKRSSAARAALVRIDLSEFTEAAHGLATARRAAGIRRSRRTGPAHRTGAPPSVLRRALRRTRKGAPGRRGDSPADSRRRPRHRCQRDARSTSVTRSSFLTTNLDAGRAVVRVAQRAAQSHRRDRRVRRARPRADRSDRHDSRRRARRTPRRAQRNAAISPTMRSSISRASRWAPEAGLVTSRERFRTTCRHRSRPLCSVANCATVRQPTSLSTATSYKSAPPSLNNYKLSESPFFPRSEFPSFGTVTFRRGPSDRAPEHGCGRREADHRRATRMWPDECVRVGM